MTEEKTEEKVPQHKQVFQQLQLQEAVLGNILDLHMRLNEISYQNAGFLIGIAGIILTLIVTIALPNIKEFNNLAVYGIAVTAFGCLVSLILSIEIIDPRFGEKNRNNLFYYRSFIEHYSIEDYSKELSKLIKNEDNIMEQYAKEIYDLSKFVLKPKFTLLKCSAVVLLVGIILGSLFAFASVLIKI